jgi:hypothetical protein
MLKWAGFIGLGLTALGILLGFYMPTIAGRFAGPDTASQEFWLQLRFATGIGCILIGTALQMYAAWPR